MAFSEVRDPGPIGAQVAIELSEHAQQLPLLGTGLFELEVLSGRALTAEIRRPRVGSPGPSTSPALARRSEVREARALD
jgi:hypothetical protein